VKPPHSARTQFQLVPQGKDSPFRFLARLLRSRCSVLLRSLCASEPPPPDERSTASLSPERQGSAAPAPHLVMFSNPCCRDSRPLALHEPASTGGRAWRPSEESFHWPPCSAGSFREGREAENAQQQKKDYENIYKFRFRFRAPEPDRTALFRTTASD
jgi:hypothetical protein